MTHALAGRCGEPRDIADDGLRHPFLDERRRALLVVAADLPDHHHQIGIGIALEPLERFDEPDPVNGIPAHPHTGRLADPATRELVHDLVGQRP